MFTRRNQKWVPRLAVILGLMGLAAKLWMNHFARDDKGLLIQGNPVGIGLLAVMALAGPLAFYAARSIEDVEEYGRSFPPSFLAFLGHSLAAAGILTTALTSQPSVAGNLPTLWRGLAYASAPCLLAAGWLRYQGKQPFFLLHLIPAMFLLIHGVCNYQTWSSQPQVINYLFSLAAIICLMLFAFYHSAFDTGLIWRKRLTFFAYASVSFGLAALPDGNYLWLYLGCSLWALLDRPVPFVRRRPDSFEEESK